MRSISVLARHDGDQRRPEAADDRGHQADEHQRRRQPPSSDGRCPWHDSRLVLANYRHDVSFVTASGDEDAERVPGRVGVDAQRLLGVVATVGQQPPAQCQDAVVLDVEVGD